MLTLNFIIYSWGKCMSCYTSIHAHLTTNKNQNPPKMIVFLSRNETTLASCVYRHWNRHASRSTRKRNLRSKIWWFTYSAIRITYRISLRSSSLWEPRHPPVRVVWHFRFCQNRRSTLVKEQSLAVFRRSAFAGSSVLFYELACGWLGTEPTAYPL